MTQKQIRNRALELLKEDAPKWKHIQYNTAALATLENRIVSASLPGCGPLTYFELMRNVMVDMSIFLPGHRGRGADQRFPRPEWKESKVVYGGMVCEFLRALSLCSASAEGFMTGSLVVCSGKRGEKSGWLDEEFFLVARELTLFSSRDDKQEFREAQRKQACDFYRANPSNRLTARMLSGIGIS